MKKTKLGQLSKIKLTEDQKKKIAGGFTLSGCRNVGIGNIDCVDSDEDRKPSA